MDTMTKPHIRWMIRRDMPTVLQIEQFGGHGALWDEETFLTMLRNRHCIGMIAEVGDTVIGFMVYELHPNRLQLIRWGGSATTKRAMARKLRSKLSGHRRTSINASLHEADLDGLTTLRGEGWIAAGLVRRGEEDGCDSIQMVLHMDWDDPNEVQE